MAVRFKKIRSLAEEILKNYGNGTVPVDIKGIAERLEVRVHISPAPDDLSGYLARDPASGITVIGVNQNHSPKRQRFTIAHELGHLLLHKGVEVHVDHTGGMPMTFQINLRAQRASEGTDDEEREANCFAAELLMPALQIEKDMREYPNIDLLDESETIAKLAKNYDVSTQAFGYRLANLDLTRDTFRNE